MSSEHFDTRVFLTRTIRLVVLILSVVILFLGGLLARISIENESLNKMLRAKDYIILRIGRLPKKVRANHFDDEDLKKEAHEIVSAITNNGPYTAKDNLRYIMAKIKDSRKEKFLNDYRPIFDRASVDGVTSVLISKSLNPPEQVSEFNYLVTGTVKIQYQIGNKKLDSEERNIRFNLVINNPESGFDILEVTNFIYANNSDYQKILKWEREK